MRCLRRVFGIALLAAIAAAAGGCAVVVPGHPDSYDLEGEQVTVKMLTWDQLKMCAGGDLQADWGAAFKPEPFEEEASAPKPSNLQTPEDKPRPMTVPAAPAVVGAIIDFASKQLADEAERYEAQFSGRVADDRFWTKETTQSGTSWRQRYYGIEVVRTTTAHATDKSASFRMVLGLCPSYDQKALLIAPIYLHCGSSKAKVLARRWWSALPPFLGYQYFLEAGDTVDQEIELELESFWMRDDAFLERQTAVVPIKLGHYSLGEKPELHAKDFGNAILGWFGTVPISSGVNSKYAGTFKVSARVTQRDPSNAKKYLEKGAELLTENRERLVSRVK